MRTAWPSWVMTSSQNKVETISDINIVSAHDNMEIETKKLFRKTAAMLGVKHWYSIFMAYTG